MVGTIILSVVVLAQAVLYHVERGKLLDRIMSKSLNEYKNADSTPMNKHESAHDRVLKRWKEV